MSGRNLGQNQAGCFPLPPVFMLSWADNVLISARYLTHRHEMDINLLISLLKRKQGLISQNVECSFKLETKRYQRKINKTYQKDFQLYKYGTRAENEQE